MKRTRISSLGASPCSKNATSSVGSSIRQFPRSSHTNTASHLLPSPPLSSGFIKTPSTNNTSTKFSVSANATTAHLAAITTLFTISTAYVAILGLLMMFFPSWSRTRQLVTSPWSIAPIAVAYGILLGWSWQPDTFSLILPGNLADGLQGGFNPQFFPSLSGIVTLFSRIATAASLWVHILAINLFAAREIFLDGLDVGVTTRHTILLCLTLAPLGVACHAVTKALTIGSSKSV